MSVDQGLGRGPARTAVVTGSASGIGRATRRRLEGDGWRVLGVDLHDAEVEADLATADGRRWMLDTVTHLSGGVLHGVVACAGVSGRTNPPELVVRLDHFGAVATLEGLRPLLAAADEGAAAVAVSSNAAAHRAGQRRRAHGVPGGRRGRSCLGRLGVGCRGLRHRQESPRRMGPPPGGDA